jgi:hypothetical protein
VLKQEIYNELIQVKIRTGNSLETYIKQRLEIEKQEPELRKKIQIHWKH